MSTLECTRRRGLENRSVWGKTTSKGTVMDRVQGPKEKKVHSMKSWLSKVRSPSSHPDCMNFSDEKAISKLEYSNFSIQY
uniref:acylphosphatase n=1 Tax=Rhinolophus ferrumequinum TaxID=59479 RepID=A0A671ENU3_RHIFE